LQPKEVLMSAKAQHVYPIGAGHPGRVPWTRGSRLLGYDPDRRRIWVGGQRLHHGATGIALATAGVVGMLRRHRARSRPLAWTLAGGALVAHDWKDRAVWFRGGRQAS
jgi:hypothetical protein